MQDATQGNAMTEIALAMAMGFFSIMVLTMMSMGVGVKDSKSISTVLLAPAANKAGPSVDSIKKDDLMIIFDGTRYLGRDLRPLDPGSIKPGQRIILAVPPNIPMAIAMKAREALKAPRLVITTLDSRWQLALKEKTNAQNTP